MFLVALHVEKVAYNLNLKRKKKNLVYFGFVLFFQPDDQNLPVFGGSQKGSEDTIFVREKTYKTFLVAFHVEKVVYNLNFKRKKTLGIFWFRSVFSTSQGQILPAFLEGSIGRF